MLLVFALVGVDALSLDSGGYATATAGAETRKFDRLMPSSQLKSYMNEMSRRTFCQSAGVGAGLALGGGAVTAAGAPKVDESDVIWSVETVEGDRLGQESWFTVSEGTVFAGTSRDNEAPDVDEEIPNELLAVDAETGDVEWRHEIGAGVEAHDSPVVGDGVVYFHLRSESLDHAFEREGVEYSEQIRALDTATGEERWTFEGWTLNVPILADGLAFVSDGTGINREEEDIDPGKLHALDPATGDEQWRFEPRGDSLGRTAGVESLAVGDGMIYAQTITDGENPNLVAIDTETGELVWDVATDTGWIVVADGTVLVPEPNYGGRLNAFDAATGDRQWQVELDRDYSFTRPIVADGLVFTTITDIFETYAFDLETGTEEWTASGLVTPQVATVSDGTLYAGLQAIDTATGERRWLNELDVYLAAATVEDGIVYVNGQGGERHGDTGVYAFTAGSGEMVWSHELEFGARYQPVVTDGDLITGSNGEIFRLQPRVEGDGGTQPTDDGQGTPTATPATESEESATDDEGGGNGSTDDGQGEDSTTSEGGGDESTDDEQGESNTTETDSPGFGVLGGVSAVGSAIYLARRRLSSRRER